MGVILLSLLLSNWWTYDSNSTVIVDSCSNSVVGNCYSYCNDVVNININITTDDLLFVTDYQGISAIVSVPHSSVTSYCIANFAGSCAKLYWQIFKLVPLLLHVLQFMLQLLSWRYYKEFVPQEKQFDIIIKYAFVDEVGSESTFVLKQIWSSSVNMMNELLTVPRIYHVFSFIEVFTVCYIWGDLRYPAVFCGAARPLSLYYYPILMTLLELTKLNIYVCVKLMNDKRYYKGLCSLFHAWIFITYCCITIWLALVFIFQLTIGMIVYFYSNYGSNKPSLQWPVKEMSIDHMELVITTNPLSNIVTSTNVTEEENSAK